MELLRTGCPNDARQQFATGDNLPQNEKGAILPQNEKSAILPQIIQLVFVKRFFGYYGNLVLDIGFNSSSGLQDLIHVNQVTFFLSNFLS